MPKNNKSANRNYTARVAIISAVKTYLAFYVFLALVVEATLGALAFQADGTNQLVIILGMILVFLGLITIVSFFAYKKPDVLLQVMASQQELVVFAESIKGCWWQKVTPDEPVALSFVEITPSTTKNAAKLNGSAYSRDGKFITYWETETSFMDSTAKRILYSWERDPSSPEYEPYQGFGQITFKEPVGHSKAHGFFLDIKFPDLTSTKKFSTEYWRAEEHEKQIMLGGRNSDIIPELIQNRLKDVS